MGSDLGGGGPDHLGELGAGVGVGDVPQADALVVEAAQRRVDVGQLVKVRKPRRLWPDGKRCKLAAILIGCLSPCPK